MRGVSRTGLRVAIAERELSAAECELLGLHPVEDVAAAGRGAPGGRARIRAPAKR